MLWTVDVKQNGPYTYQNTRTFLLLICLHIYGRETDMFIGEVLVMVKGAGTRSWREILVIDSPPESRTRVHCSTDIVFPDPRCLAV